MAFGGVHALTDVDLQVAEGELVGLIGPNGAGKTTFIDAITGFVSPLGQRGSWPDRTSPGWRRTPSPGWAAPAPGRAPTCSTTSTSARTSPSPPAKRRAAERVEAVLTRTGLAPVAEAMPGELSEGQRKLVGLARAIVGAPRLLCLDEPAAGMDTRESEALGRRLRELADQGQSTLLIDHDMGLVLGICDRVVVLEFGRVIAAGAPEAVRRDPAVMAAYLGGAAESAAAVADPSTP